MRLLRKILVLLLCLPGQVFANTNAGAGADSSTVRLDNDCSIEVPPGAKMQPKPEWYNKFKQVFDDGEAQKAFKDADSWRSKDHKFDTCAAFKLLMGIGSKESGLNPNAGPGADPIPSPGMFQIQQRNCDGVGVRGDLNDPMVSVECAAKIMRMNFGKDGCIADTANQKGNGRCLTNWSVMICHSNNKVGHREEIRQYQNGQSFCQ